MTLKKSLTLFKVMILIGRKRINNILRKTSDKVKALIIIFLLLILSGACGYFLSNEVLSLYFNGDIKAIYMLLMSECITISAITAMFFILVRCMVPEQNTMTKLLQCFPIREIEKRIGYYLPIIISIILSSFIFVFTIYIPSMFVNKISLNIIIGFIVCLLLQSFVITLILLSIYNLLLYVTNKLKIPYYKSLSSVVLVLLVVKYTMTYMKSFADVLKDYIHFKYSIAHITAPIISLFSSEIPAIEFKYTIIFGVIFIWIIVFLLTASLGEINEEAKPLKIFCFIRFTKNTLLNLGIKEFKILVRNEQVVMFNILACIIAVLLRFVIKITIENFIACLIIGVLSSFAALYSYGLEESKIALYKSMGISCGKFTIGKIIGNIMASSFMFLVLSIILFNLDVNWSGIIYGFGIMILGVLSLYFVGLTFLINEDRPFAQGTVSLIIMLSMIPVLYLVNKLLSLGKSAICIIVLGSISLILYMIAREANRKWFYEV